MFRLGASHESPGARKEENRVNTRFAPGKITVNSDKERRISRTTGQQGKIVAGYELVM